MKTRVLFHLRWYYIIKYTSFLNKLNIILMDKDLVVLGI